MFDHHHGENLAEDLGRMCALVERRRALKWFAGAGTAAIVAGCGGSGEADTGSAVAVTAPTTSTNTTSSTPATTTPASTSCVATGGETAGPYPADGTNTSAGETSNVMAVNGVVRSDIRTSFISSSTAAAGVKLVLTLRLVDVNASCAPLAGYAIYLWHADRLGNYSLYGSAALESYLRGVQVTDTNGEVTFTTIYPACYDGRFPHMHFEVFSSLYNAIGGRYAILISQLAMPTATSALVYADTVTYPGSATRAASITTARDNVFSDNSAAQLAQQTPTLSGNVTDGFTGSVVIGIAR